MICLFCEADLPTDVPQKCENCGTEHESRPPIVGVNHVSQLLCSLDAVQSQEMGFEDFHGVLEVFLDRFEAFEQVWKTRHSSLRERLSPGLEGRFGQSMLALDEAFNLGFQALEDMQCLNEDSLPEHFEQAESALVNFFRGTCAQAASALEAYDQLQAQGPSSGRVFNLPSV